MPADSWPDLPIGIKNGIAARVGSTAYVGLGSAGSDLYSLNLDNPELGWVRRAAFAGPATNGAAAAAVGKTIYVFGGNGKATEDAISPIIFDTVFAYDTDCDAWSRIDTQTPVGVSGAKAVALSDGRIAIFGGYNKDLFDKFHTDVAAIDKDINPDGFRRYAEAYLSMEPKDYRWNNKVLSYDAAANDWQTLGETPYLPNCDPAIVGHGDDTFLVISGEIKPGLRTPDVKLVKIEKEAVVWQSSAGLPKPAADSRQEGVAGAFACEATGARLVAGGTNFKGAGANSEAGKWFAHDGLKKCWRDEIYLFDGSQWNEVGKLPIGLAYGASIGTPQGMLVVGGEDSDGMARADVFLVHWDGKVLSVEK